MTEHAEPSKRRHSRLDLTDLGRVGYPRPDWHLQGPRETMWNTVEVARYFGINPNTLRTLLSSDPDAPHPTVVLKTLSGGVRHMWNEADRNKIALWWTRRPKRGKYPRKKPT